MKLRIKDQFYDHIAARNDSSLGLLMELKETTGLGRQSLERQLAKFGKEVKTSDDVFEDPDLLRAIIALAWLCKRHAGEEFTFSDAKALQFTDLEFVSDEGDEPAPDPTVASAEAPSGVKSNGGKSSKHAIKRPISAAS